MRRADSNPTAANASQTCCFILREFIRYASAGTDRPACSHARRSGKAIHGDALPSGVHTRALRSDFRDADLRADVDQGAGQAAWGAAGADVFAERQEQAIDLDGRYSIGSFGSSAFSVCSGVFVWT